MSQDSSDRNRHHADEATRDVDLLSGLQSLSVDAAVALLTSIDRAKQFRRTHASKGANVTRSPARSPVGNRPSRYGDLLHSLGQLYVHNLSTLFNLGIRELPRAGDNLAQVAEFSLEVATCVDASAEWSFRVLNESSQAGRPVVYLQQFVDRRTGGRCGAPGTRVIVEPDQPLDMHEEATITIRIPPNIFTAGRTYESTIVVAINGHEVQQIPVVITASPAGDP